MHEFWTDLHAKYGPIAKYYHGPHLIVSTSDSATFRPQMSLFDRPGKNFLNLIMLRVDIIVILVELFEQFMPLVGPKSLQYRNGNDGRLVRRHLDRSYSHEACCSYLGTFLQVNMHALPWKIKT